MLTWNYIVQCKSCNNKLLINSFPKETTDWNIFHASLTNLREKGFTYNVCESRECLYKITKQELISYDNITKQ